MMRTAGFTLLEMLVALAVFAMIAAMAYAVMAPAGEGFRDIQHVRKQLDASYLLSRRMREDFSYLSVSQDEQVHALRLTHDLRGGANYDHVWLLVRDMSESGLSMVHYFLDEEKKVLVRETLFPWARTGSSPLRWEFGKMESFEVQAMDEKGAWHNLWDSGVSKKLPRALRVRMRDEGGSHERVLPVFIEIWS